MELLSATLEWDRPMGVQTSRYVNICKRKKKTFRALDGFKNKKEIYTKVPLNYIRNCLP